jgi:hypothetical protein
LTTYRFQHKLLHSCRSHHEQYKRKDKLLWWKENQLINWILSIKITNNKKLDINQTKK